MYSILEEKGKAAMVVHNDKGEQIARIQIRPLPVKIIWAEDSIKERLENDIKKYLLEGPLPLKGGSCKTTKDENGHIVEVCETTLKECTPADGDEFIKAVYWFLSDSYYAKLIRIKE